MGVVVTAAAVKIVSKSLGDIYELGKSKFDKELTKWRNSAAQRDLVKKVSTAEMVKTFWQRDKSVKLSSFYYPNKIHFRGGVPVRANSLKDLPREGNYVIQGTVGQGKSMFLRHLCVNELTTSGTARIPLFVELWTISERGLVKEIYATLESLGFAVNDELFDLYATSGKLVVLLDAFDELDEKFVKAVILEIERLAERYESLQFLVTSRPQSAIADSRHFQTIRLIPLSQKDHQPFLEKLGVPAAEAERILKATRSGASEVYKLLTTPLMLTLLLVVYQSEKSIPPELPDFFEKLFETLFSKHDNSKPAFRRIHRTGLSERKLQQLFEAFCFSALANKHIRSLSRADFNTCFDKALKHFNTPCEADDFRHDIVRVACLMQEEGFSIHFVHRSVLEFYAASFVAGKPEEIAKNFYKQLIGAGWGVWNQVLNFLEQIDHYRFVKYFLIPDAEKTLKWLDANDVDKFDNQLIGDTLNKILDGYCVEFIENNNEIDLWGSGPYKRTYRALAHISDALTNVLVEDAAVEVFKTFTAEKKNEYQTEDQDIKIYAVPWSVLISDKLHGVLLTRTKLSIVELRDSLKDYSESIRDEDSKELKIEM